MFFLRSRLYMKLIMDKLNLFFCLFALCFCLTGAEIYNITQSENVVIGGSATLSIRIPNIKRPAVWVCGTKKYECDRTCVNGSEFQVRQWGNMSSLWIRRVMNKCLTWKFYDDNFNMARIRLKINDSTRIEIYKITQNGPVVLGGNVTIHIEASLIETPISWTNGRNNLQCVTTCDNKNDKYEITHFGNVSILSIRNVTEQDFTWRFCDFYFCSENYTLVMKDEEAGTGIPISAILLISILGVVAVLFIILSVKFEWRPYIWIRTRVIKWQSHKKYQNPPQA